MAAEPPEPLWPDEDIPYALSDDHDDRILITPYPADVPNGTSVIVCPGGGYGGHAPHEAEPVALWLNTLGITAFVLKYRLGPRYRYPAISLDGARAVRYVRHSAERRGLHPQRIGILGFSAGGHLASTVATHSFDPLNDTDPVERRSARPDFAVLIYPVITMSEPFFHAGSRRNLLGEAPSPEMVMRLSNDSQVTSATPPILLVHSSDDEPVPVENSLNFALALSAAGVPFAMQVYAHGGHGYGLGGNDEVLSMWRQACAGFLRQQGFLE
ncbi:MAG: alpha/beta hydrolase [Capsulimonadales bacterium]|nr:alpha/beta hydrolase [Capsulimonadales bacterium]